MQSKPDLESEAISDQASAYSDISINDEESQINDHLNDDSVVHKNETESIIGKKKPWKEILMLSFSSLGAIYGDIGTSPLYVLNSIKYPTSPPSDKDIYGAISVIFYLFTIIVIIKYLMIVLMIGPNNGEGGQVAIYAKIARHLKIGPKGVTIPGSPEKDDLLLLTRQETSSSFVSMNKKVNDMKNHPKVISLVSKLILVTCFLGCSLIISDGLLTPTTSVLSAIAGIKIAKPNFDSVLPVSEVILIALFALQQIGSSKIAFLFAPIIFVWLIGLIVCGAINISHHPYIFKALSPVYAINFLKQGGIDVFSGAMLAITGTEAMFADIGHFGALPIQIALAFLVYPSLIICYLGQAAYIIKHPNALENPFFLSIPGGLNSPSYWVMFILATLSTIIASQALILGVFSILAQLINLDCFPNLKIIHISKDYSGKVYIPVANWVLMIGVICTTAGFKNSNNVTSAYGLGITLDFIVTSFLIAICMIYVYEWNILIPIIFIFVFMPLEAIMVGANLKKFLHGAWFPILMAGIFFIFLCFWRWARSRKVNYEYSSRVRVGELFPKYNCNQAELQLGAKSMKPGEDEERGRTREVMKFHEFGISLKSITRKEEISVNTLYGVSPLHIMDGAAIMYTEAVHTLNSPNTVPGLYKTMVSNFPSIPKVFIFCAIRVLSIPQVQQESRILIAAMKIPGHYRCILRFGYMENVKINQDTIQCILRCIPENIKVESTTVVHILENEQIRAKIHSPTKNPIKLCQQKVRKFLINDVFAPINSIFRTSEEILDLTIENCNRLFIGGEVHI